MTAPHMRGLVCSGDEVRGLLDGSVRQLRRPVNMTGIRFVGAGGESGPDWNDPDCWGYEADDGRWYRLDQAIKRSAFQDKIQCPFGVSGERRRVKEKWAPVDHMNGCEREEPVDIGYAADLTAICHEAGNVHKIDTYAWNWAKILWRSPVTMPQWASRLTVTIGNVEVGRVGDGWEWVLAVSDVGAR